MSHTIVARVEDFQEGQSRIVEHAGRFVAVFCAEGEFFAVENECPHVGAPLASGSVDDCVVTCPLHGWSFNLRDGSPVSAPPSAALECFAVSIADGEVRIATQADASEDAKAGS